MSRKRNCTKNMVNNVLECNNVETYTLVHECRVCLLAVDTKYVRNMLLPWKENLRHSESTVAQDFEKITNIQISPTDSHTKFICNQCLMKLKICLQFVHTAQYSDNILHKRCATIVKPMDNGPAKPLWPKPIQIDKVIGADHLEVEVKQEVLSDDENVMETEELEHEELSMDIKVEPEEYHYKETPVHGIFSPDNIKPVNGYQHIDNNVNVMIKEEPLSDQDDVEMVPDMPLDCMLCMKTFNSVSGLKAHVIAQHSYVTIDRKTEVQSKKQLFSCTTCRRNFLTNTDLLVHETCHSTHACYMCHTKFDTFAQLTQHRNKCPNNVPTVTRAKTLEDVKRPSPEPRHLLQDKELEQSQNVPEIDQIDSNTQLESHIAINNSIESNSLEVDNSQQITSDIEQTESNKKEDSNEQASESENLVPHSRNLEQNNTNAEFINSFEAGQNNSNTELSTASESTDRRNSNENPLETNKFSHSKLDNTNCESDDTLIDSNLQLITNEKNAFNLESVSSKELADSGHQSEINDSIGENTVTTTVIIGTTNSGSPNSLSVVLNPKFNEETHNTHSEPASSHPGNNSLDSENNRSDTGNNSPDKETTSVHAKTDIPEPETKPDSFQIESVSLNLEHVSPELKCNDTHTKFNLESNTSIELSSLESASANQRGAEEEPSKDSTHSSIKEIDSDMKIHLEIHSIDKKVSIDKESDIKGLDSVELNEDNILQ